MRNQNLKSPLLFALECDLIGIELFNQLFLAARIVKSRGAFEDNRDAEIPAAIFGRVITGFFDLHTQDATRFDLLLQDRQMILFEKLQELIGITPFGFVIVLDYVWLVRLW